MAGPEQKYNTDMEWLIGEHYAIGVFIHAKLYCSTRNAMHAYHTDCAGHAAWPFSYKQENLNFLLALSMQFNSPDIILLKLRTLSLDHITAASRRPISRR